MTTAKKEIGLIAITVCIHIESFGSMTETNKQTKQKETNKKNTVASKVESLHAQPLKPLNDNLFI